jgi:predicted transcriptional regulator
MGFLWAEARPVIVRQVQVAFPELAYTTLMTTLDRLHRKGLLVRRLRGRAYAYVPCLSRHELAGKLLTGQISDLLANSDSGVELLSALVRSVGRHDAALLDELEALVKAERLRIGQGQVP